MYGEVEDDGLITKGSTDYIMIVHKDSTNISKSNHPNFSLELDRFVMSLFSELLFRVNTLLNNP